jgi:glycosyltransferase involved in cell wall biosynthesis
VQQVVAGGAARTPGRDRTLLYLVTEDWYFASHRLTLATRAVRAGFRVIVVCRVRDHGDIIRAAGCEVVPLTISRSGLNPLREAICLWRLRRLYRDLRPAIVHHVALKPVVYGSLAAQAAAVPCVVNALAGLGFLFTSASLKARTLRPILNIALRRVLNREGTRTIVQNPDDRRMLISKGIARSEHMLLLKGVGADLKRFRPLPEPAGPPVVLFPARMLWAKGVGTFVETARRLTQSGVPARFVLAGRLDPENPTAVSESMLREWVAGGAVEWLGHCEEMDQVFASAAIVCLPSAYGEGVPKVLLEAAASGRPLVTTDIPGCREVVRDGDNGLLVAPGDSVALANALRRLILDPGLRARYGARSRQRAELEFSEEPIISGTLRLYEDLLTQSRVSR